MKCDFTPAQSFGAIEEIYISLLIILCVVSPILPAGHKAGPVFPFFSARLELSLALQLTQFFL